MNIKSALFLLPTIFFISCTIRAQTAVTVTAISKEMSKGVKPGYKVTIPETSLDNVKYAWEALERTNSKGKKQTVNTEESMTGVLATQISLTPLTCIYTRYEEAAGSVMMYVYIEVSPDSYVSSTSGEKDAGAKKYLRDFATDTYRGGVQKTIEAEMKKLLDAEKVLSDKVADEENAKGQIAALNCGIQKSDEVNQFIVKKQALNNQQITRQKDLVSRLKLNPKEKADASQKVLDNLLSQKAKLDKDAQKNTLDAGVDREKIKDRQKNVERAIKEQAVEKTKVDAQQKVVNALLAKLSAIK